MFRIMAILAAAVMAISCGPKSEKNETSTGQPMTQEARLPEGYPQELALPDGFTASDINVGDGTVSGGEKGTRSFLFYRIEKVSSGDKSSLVEHYKRILAENGWQGDLKSSEPGYGSGSFVKGNMELELKINDMLFSFKLKVYQE